MSGLTPESSNNNNNSNSSCVGQVLGLQPAEKLFIGVVLTLITAGTVVGNILAVISVCLVKKLRQPSNYLLVSLAGADLSVALAVMPFVIVTDLTGGEWLFGEVFCDIFIAMDVVCCTASIMTLCMISVDRYLGITKPLTYPARQSGCLMAKMVVGVWISSASLTLPPFFGWARNVNGNNVCLISQDFGYTVYSTLAAFYIPTAVMLIMYYKIFRAAKKCAASHRFASFPEDPGGAGDCKARLGQACPSFSRLLRGRERRILVFKGEDKAATTLGILVGVFTICWLPFFIQSTARPFICGIECSCIPIWLERALLWLGYTNSLMNPFIYAFFNRDLRTIYKDLLRCRCRNINRRLSAVWVQQALKV
uniref:5-hydroxytryptamine receptor 7-like n=1 Tax=Pristiophorus japonicus TaxID=55135 RepID=UPI00398E4A86